MGGKYTTFLIKKQTAKYFFAFPVIILFCEEESD